MNAFQRAAARLLGFSRLIDAANPREIWQRPIEASTTDTIGREVNIDDWRQLLSDSRKLFCNLGPAKGAVCDKAIYAVGRAWNPKFTGEDDTWGDMAEQWLRDMWYPMADVRGGMYDFKTDLYIASICVDRDGEVFIMLTESPDGWPQIQIIPAHQVGTRGNYTDRVQSGPYKGLRNRQGLVVNDSGATVAFQLLGENADEDQYISARDMIHLYDPEWPDQIRGFPCFTHAILDLKDLRLVQGYEKMASAMAASIGLIETNELGAPDPNDPMSRLRRSATNTAMNSTPEIITQDTVGVRTLFFRSKSGSGIQSLKTERPGAAWESFMDRLIRNACTGAGWPFELTWDSSKLGGANVRLLLARAMRTVEDRQDLLAPVARRVCGYAVAKAAKSGLIAPSPEWYKWRFTKPQKITVDYGRDGQSDREDYLLGIKNLTTILAEEGIELDHHIQEREDENEALREAKLPVPIAPSQAQAATGSDGQTSFEQVKGMMDAYGVGVRAGALTPVETDEAFFREKAGLPNTSPKVGEAWEEDNGIRRPITLLRDGKPPTANAQTDAQKNDASASASSTDTTGEEEAVDS